MRGTYKNPTEDALGIGSDLASPAPGGTGASPAPGGTGPTQFRLYERTYPPEGGERRSPKGIVRSYLNPVHDHIADTRINRTALRHPCCVVETSCDVVGKDITASKPLLHDVVGNDIDRLLSELNGSHVVKDVMMTNSVKTLLDVELNRKFRGAKPLSSPKSREEISVGPPHGSPALPP